MSFENKVIEWQLQREAWKLRSESTKEISKIRNALDREDQESARLYAMESIRKKEQANHCERTVTRLDMIQSQLDHIQKKRNGSKINMQCIQTTR